jgi:predicted HicB family RNase H-like nuclease
MLTYKGYTGHVELDAETGLFHGEVRDTRDVITFQGTSVEELTKAFHDSIDDYLEFCPGPKGQQGRQGQQRRKRCV